MNYRVAAMKHLGYVQKQQPHHKIERKGENAHKYRIKQTEIVQYSNWNGAGY